MPLARPATPPPAFLSQQVTAARRFYLDLKPRLTKGLTVVCGGWEECAPDYTIDRATFPYLSIEFVAAGRGHVALGGQTHPLAPGTVFTYGPGVAHYICTSPAVPPPPWARQPQYVFTYYVKRDCGEARG